MVRILCAKGCRVRQSQDWFYRYTGWNNAKYFWPCHWVGVLLMLGAITLGLTLASLIVGLARTLGHPALSWLSVVAVAVVYGVFDRVADRHVRI
jgi:hypothetical protein